MHTLEKLARVAVLALAVAALLSLAFYCAPLMARALRRRVAGSKAN